MKTSRLWLYARLGIAAGAVGLLVGGDRAIAKVLQRELAIDIVNPVNPAAGNEKTMGVYVRESTTASDAFNNGVKMERLKEWHKALEFYQEVLDDKYRDIVTPSATDEKNNIYQYASIMEAVRQRLVRWPEEGLEVYRARYEPAAAALLDQAKRGDETPLHQVINKYFPTESGKAAGIRLVDLFLESGDYTAAAQVADRLLGLHPTVVTERPKLLFRSALAYHLSGDSKTASERYDELKKNHSDALGRVMGKDVVLAEELDRQFAIKPPTSLYSGTDSWLRFGGNASCSLVPSGGGMPGARMYGIAFGEVALPKNNPNMPQLEPMYKAAVVAGATITVFPSIDRGQMFFQNGQSLWAVQLESGMPLPGWVQSHSGGVYRLPKGQMDPNAPMYYQNYGINPFTMPRQHSVTLTETSALAVMGMRDIAAVYGGGRTPGMGTRLVCLDRETGRERWPAATPRDNPADKENVKAVNFTGAPLVVGDAVYVPARAGGGMSGDASYVYCYDVNTGAFRWASYLASTMAGASHMYGGVPMQDTICHLSYASGRLYCLTNIGAIAALDAYNGAVTWLNIYPRDAAGVDPNTGVMMFRRAALYGGNPSQGSRPWQYNAPILQDGKLFVMPNDGKFFMVYDAVTGKEICRIDPKDVRDQDPTKTSDVPDTLLGVVGSKIILAGANQVVAVNWEKWDPKQKWSGNPGFWRSPTPEILGRGFITSDHVFVPTKTGLFVLKLNGGRVLDRFPKGDKHWSDEEGPGNVVVTDDHVAVAGAKGVNVYTDLDRIEKKFTDAVAADPRNPEPHLLHAERMMNAGQIARATKSLDQAQTILGGGKNMRVGAMRDRVFGDAITFAQRLAKDLLEKSAQQAGDRNALVAEINGFFDRAADAALTPSQQVTYRLARAQFIDSMGAVAGVERIDPAKAVDLYQEILQDPSMRIITVGAEEGPGALQAAKKAELAINKLISTQGVSVYGKHEKEAAARLEKLKEKAEPQSLLSLAEGFPNSKVALQAMMLAGESFEKVGEPRLATQVLRRVYRGYGNRFEDANKARLHEAMARCYLRVGNNDAAIARLAKSATLTPDAALNAPLKLASGDPLKGANGQEPKTIKEAAEALASLGRHMAGEALPDLNIPFRPERQADGTLPKIPQPFDKTRAVALANVKSIAATPREVWQAARFDRIIASMGGQVACLEPGKAQPVWANNDLSTVVGCAWTADQVIVWGASEIGCFNGKTGKAAWKHDLKTLQAVDLVGGGNPEPAAAAQPAAVDPNERVMQIRGRLMINGPVAVGGGVAALNPARAPALGGPEAVHHVRPLSDRAIVTTTTGRIVAFELKSGKPLWQTRPANRYMEHCVASDDFVAVRVVDDGAVQVLVFDAFTGQQIFRKSFMQNQGNWPINIALAADGMLIYTTFQQMAGFDMYEPGEAVKWQTSTGHNYNGMSQPDQLVIWGDQVLALSDTGAFVDRRFIRDGRAYGGRESSWLQTKASNDLTARIRVTGSNLYVVGTRSLVWYGLDAKPDEAPPTWSGRMDMSDVTSLPNDVAVGKDYLVVPGTFTNENGERRYCMQAYSLATINTGGRAAQSGLLVYGRERTEINEPAGITQWQATTGGIIYITGDEKLTMLRGNRGK